MIDTVHNPWDWQIEEGRKAPDGFTYAKYVAYKITLYFNHVVCQLNAFVQSLLSIVGIPYKSRWAWWNVIAMGDPTRGTLYLGALPLMQKFLWKTVRNDAATLVQLGIRAVLSVTEPFENHVQGCVFSAVTPAHWENRGIQHLQLSTPDFGKTITLEKIQRGVEFIHWNIQSGRSVYVHCKAGRGRSALIALCYLIKYHRMSAEQALQTLRRHRSQVKLEINKWASAKEYERWMKENL